MGKKRQRRDEQSVGRAPKVPARARGADSLQRLLASAAPSSAPPPLREGDHATDTSLESNSAPDSLTTVSSPDGGMAPIGLGTDPCMLWDAQTSAAPSVSPRRVVCSGCGCAGVGATGSEWVTVAGSSGRLALPLLPDGAYERLQNHGAVNMCPTCSVCFASGMRCCICFSVIDHPPADPQRPNNLSAGYTSFVLANLPRLRRVEDGLGTKRAHVPLSAEQRETLHGVTLRAVQRVRETYFKRRNISFAVDDRDVAVRTCTTCNSALTPKRGATKETDGWYGDLRTRFEAQSCPSGRAQDGGGTALRDQLEP